MKINNKIIDNTLLEEHCQDICLLQKSYPGDELPSFFFTASTTFCNVQLHSK